MKKFTIFIVCILFSLNLFSQISLTATSGTATGSYATLKTAFDNINNGTHRGDIEILITANTTETTTATLNASGSGSASYTSVNIQPADSGTARSISGSINGTLISLNGADNVTINGLNTGGNSLTIENASTGSSSTTISFNNDACSNTVTNCYINGSSTATSYGVVYFGNSAASTGSDNNTISNCDIGKAGSNCPYYLIYSYGSSSYTNSGNAISGCNIHDYFRNGSSAVNAAIYLYGNNTEWNISNNKIYQTSSRSFSNSSLQYYGIYVNGGQAYTIENNVIGYAASDGTGTTELSCSSSGFTFYGIRFGTNGTTVSSVSDNEIAGLSINTGSNYQSFYGMFFTSSSGMMNTEIDGNTIGSLTTANSIVLPTTGSLYINGIYLENNIGFNITISNNNIGSINSSSSHPSACYANLINLLGTSSSTITVTGNTIGAAGAEISPGTHTASGDHRLTGINSSCYGTVNCSNNTISHIYVNATGTTVSELYGIKINELTANVRTFQNNIIHDIITYTSYAYRGPAGFYVGPWGSSGGVNILDNTIYNIKYVNGANVRISTAGIAIPGGTQTVIARNKIYNIENNSTYAWGTTTYNREGIYGIEMNNSTNSSYTIEIYNNLIYLRAQNSGELCVPIHGMSLHSKSKVYYNTVVISGTACGSASNIPTCCFDAGQYLEIPVYNNIFVNDRTGGGKHCTLINDGYTGSTSSGNYAFVPNYNVYYTSDTNTMGKWSSSTRTFTQWKAVYAAYGISADIHSVFADPLLQNITDTAGNFDLFPASNSPALDLALYYSSVLTDYLEVTRDDVSPDAGAYELVYSWNGAVSEDWSTSGNWVRGSVPSANAVVSILSAGVSNHCMLDSNRTIRNFSNSNGTYKLNTNGNQLTITGNIATTNGGSITADIGQVIMQGTSAQSISSGAFTSNSLNYLKIDNSNGITLGGALSITGNLVLNSGQFSTGGNLTIADGAMVTVTEGSLSQIPTYAGEIDVTYNQTASIIQTGNELPDDDDVIRDFTVNTTNGVKLFKDITINRMLDLKAGVLDIRLNNLKLAPDATIENYSSSKYIIAGDVNYSSGTGRLSRFVNSTTTETMQFFPIGTTSSYTPCYISNNNPTGTYYNVNLFDKVMNWGTYGPEITAQVINRTWDIVPENELNANSTTLKLVWYDTDESVNFDRATIKIWKNRHVISVDEQWNICSGTLTSQTDSLPYWVSVDGITTFSNFIGGTDWGGSSNLPLPVSLLSFSTYCNGNENILNWATATEINNDYFTIEKSSDTRTWNTIGKVDGAGNSNETRSYSFSDKASASTVYYRLKQTDFDGKYSYSDVISSKPCNENGNFITNVYPNPFADKINITFYSETEGLVNISLHSLLGKVVFTTSVLAVKGENKTEIMVNDIEKGTYLLYLSNSAGSYLISHIKN